ncbi:class I adenylate-forming enzyme family protein [Micromonospora sp. NPDC049048]|uniref:class I adenylate-forming enzyme family protein n=1 Tax=Micromonospora sp. NPDC049048 TaxID=3364263 RepID=UPI003713DC1C
MNLPTSPAATASQLIRHWAGTTPDAVAISFEGRHETFADFDRTVDEWAKALLALGVSRGEGISILSGNHPDFLHLAFAAARVGAHLVPQNTWHHAEEIAYTLEHSESTWLFTVPSLRRHDYAAGLAQILPELAESGAELHSARFPHLRGVVSLRGEIAGARTLASVLAAGEQVPAEALGERERQNRPEDLMYLLYTSGSTAKPKSVMLAQGAMIENNFHIGARQGVDAQDRTWLATPLFYGLSAIQGLFSTWTHGGRVVLQEVFDAAAALEMLEKERCTVYYGFGNLTRKLLSTPGFDKSRLFLRKGMIGFSYEDRKLALDDLGITYGTSVYGMTELYGLATLTAWDDDHETILTTQGLPVPGQEVVIVDPETEEPLAPGEVGAVLVRGRVTPGYFKDPERTAETIREDGFFRTGDLARFDENGRMVYQARATEMMKPGGINVSPQEVESLLDGLDGVKQAHVCSIPDDEAGEVVVAFIEADPRELPLERIRATLAQRAASYKIPRIVHYRTDEQIPRLSNGKVPRTALRAEAIALANGARDDH